VDNKHRRRQAAGRLKTLGTIQGVENERQLPMERPSYKTKTDMDVICIVRTCIGLYFIAAAD